MPPGMAECLVARAESAHVTMHRLQVGTNENDENQAGRQAGRPGRPGRQAGRQAGLG